MTSKTMIRIGITGVIAIVVMAFLLASFNEATPAAANACNENMDECSQKKETQETGFGIGLETFSGKFFSSVSY